MAKKAATDPLTEQLERLCGLTRDFRQNSLKRNKEANSLRQGHSRTSGSGSDNWWWGRGVKFLTTTGWEGGGLTEESSFTKFKLYECLFTKSQHIDSHRLTHSY